MTWRSKTMDRKVIVSKGNSKMGLIYSVSLPPITSCRANAPCSKGCYALKGTFGFPNVKSSYQKNLEFFLESPKEFELSILKQIPMYGVFRWNVAGDVLNVEYLEMILRIARKLKNVKFLLFTKKYELINENLKSKPRNLSLVFSAWNGLEFDNPNNYPIAYVEDKKNLDSRIPKNTKPCNGDCSQCMTCWDLKKRESVTFKKH